MPTKAASPVTRTLLACGVAVPLLYYGLQALAAPFYPGFAFATTTASELGSDRFPWASVFNAGVALMALCTVAASAGVLRALRALGHDRPLAFLAAGLLATNAFQTGWAATFPMPDPRHGGHPIFIVGMLMLTPVCAALAWRHSSSRAVRGAMLAAVLLLVAAVPVMSGALGIDTSNWRGAVQRVFTLAIFPPIAVLCGVLRARIGTTGEGAPTRPTAGGLSLVVLSFFGLGGLAPPEARAALPAVTSGTPPSIAALWQSSMTLGTLHQRPGQSEQHFLREAAALVDSLTGALAAEVCGVFERSGDGTHLLITLLTQGSIGYCLNRRPVAPAEAGGLAGQSLHSHVGPHAVRRDDADCGELETGLARLPLGSPAERMARLLGDRFSERDIDAGPGFLVHRGRLWHQQGWGTQRYVARVDSESDATRGARLARWTTEHAWTAACA